MPGPIAEQSGAAEPQRIVRPALQTPSLLVEMRHYCWAEPQHESALVSDRWFLDLSLSARPGAPHGRYLERWSRRRIEPIGDVILVPPSLEFRGSHGPGRQSSLSLLIAPEVFDLALDEFDEAKLAEGLHIADRDVRRGLWRLALEIQRRRIETPALIEGAAIAVAGKVAKRLRRMPAGTGAKRGGLPPARLRRIEERIQADLPPPSISELARLCGLGERQLARAFRQETGEAIGARVATAALQRAWTLLSRSETPVGAIAAALGYSSSAAFAAAFRNSTGFTPSVVREAAARPRRRWAS